MVFFYENVLLLSAKKNCSKVISETPMREQGRYITAEKPHTDYITQVISLAASTLASSTGEKSSENS